mgnify:CR=1 FL=1
MKHTIIEKAALKAKSEETGIPFSNLLAGYVLDTEGDWGRFYENYFLWYAGIRPLLF